MVAIKRHLNPLVHRLIHQRSGEAQGLNRAIGAMAALLSIQ
jgi:hypothetical protein